MRRLLVLALLLAGACAQLWAQQSVHPRNTLERLICVVPMIGSGTAEDPRRPMYTPAPGEAPDPDGILGFTATLSDNGHFALVEYVARNRAAFRQILAERRADVKVFEKGKARRADIEREFRLHKSRFNLDDLGVVVR